MVAPAASIASIGRVERRADLGRGVVDPLPRHADARAVQSVRVQELRVVGGNVRRARPAPPAERHAAGRGIASVAGSALDDAQHRRRVGHGARVRTHRVLDVRDRHHARAAGEPDRRLEAHHAVDVGRADDAAVGLRSERHRGEVRGRRRARAGARAAGVAIERVRVVGQAAAARPAAGREERAEVRPLREVRLAEDHRAARAQLGRHRRVLHGAARRPGRTSPRWSASGRRCRCCP